MELTNKEKIKLGGAALGGVASGVAYHQKYSSKKTKHRILKSVGVGILGNIVAGAVINVADGMIPQSNV